MGGRIVIVAVTVLIFKNIPPPPVTVLCAGDTSFSTDGALNSIQHLVEASERGFKMPIVYLVNMNNSAISTR
jgi:hypothetical protein